MTRYRMRGTSNPYGHADFTAEDDAAALEYAQRNLYGQRLVSLGEIEMRADGDRYRPIPLPETP